MQTITENTRLTLKIHESGGARGVWSEGDQKRYRGTFRA